MPLSGGEIGAAFPIFSIYTCRGDTLARVSVASGIRHLPDMNIVLPEPLAVEICKLVRVKSVAKRCRCSGRSHPKKKENGRKK